MGVKSFPVLLQTEIELHVLYHFYELVYQAAGRTRYKDDSMMAILIRFKVLRQSDKRM
jgi:hypothetical protein